MLKDLTQLIQGDCIVIARDGDREKDFKGVYSESARAVFFTIPAHYEIVGYVQGDPPRNSQLS